MKNLIIIGAGGFGREVYTLVNECIAFGLDLRIKGFLDLNPKALANHQGYSSIIGDVIDYTPKEDDVFIIAITSKERKKICSEIIFSKGGQFVSIIHPSAHLSSNQAVKNGTTIILLRRLPPQRNSKYSTTTKQLSATHIQ